MSNKRGFNQIVADTEEYFGRWSYHGRRANKKTRYAIPEDDFMIYATGSEIHFTADINDETIEAMIKVLTNVIKEQTNRHLGEDEKADIVYIVDSPGGHITSVLKFVDFIKMSKKKYPQLRFTSVITGRAASAGTIMSVVADRRKMTENAFAMIHELNGGGYRMSYTEQKSSWLFSDKLHHRLNKIYLDHIDNEDLDEEKLEVLLRNTSWFSAEEYKELGFVQEII